MSAEQIEVEGDTMARNAGSVFAEEWRHGICAGALLALALLGAAMLMIL
jgi:hypothetical protein